MFLASSTITGRIRIRFHVRVCGKFVVDLYIKFIRACINHESSLVRGLAFYCITFARNESFIGRNILFCADRYHCAVNDILHGSINNIINSYVKFNTTDARVQTTDLLCELLNIRDSRDLFTYKFL